MVSGYYVKLVLSAMSPIPTLSSKPIVFHRVINSRIKLNLDQHLITCKERVEHPFPTNVYQLRETLFDKVDSFNVPHSDDQKLFKNMAKFDFELKWVQEDKFRNIDNRK